MKKIFILLCIGIFLLSGCSNTQKFERIIEKADDYKSYTVTISVNQNNVTSTTIMEVDNINNTAKISTSGAELSSENYYKDNVNDTATMYVKLSDGWYKTIVDESSYKDTIDNNITDYVDEALKIEKVKSETDEDKYEVFVNLNDIEDSQYNEKITMNYYVKDSLVKRITYEIDNVSYVIEYSNINSTDAVIPEEVLKAAGLN